MTFNNQPLVSYEILPPAGLTKSGNDRQLLETTKGRIAQTLQAMNTQKSDQLRAAINETYKSKWSTGETANSISQQVTITDKGITAVIFMGSSAMRFITNWAGLGKMLIPGQKGITPIRAKRRGKGKRGFMVWRDPTGATYRAKEVIHPGFTRDPISEQLFGYQDDVESAVIDTVKESTIVWANGLGPPAPRSNLRRQYRYQTLAGRP